MKFKNALVRFLRSWKFRIFGIPCIVKRCARRASHAATAIFFEERGGCGSVNSGRVIPVCELENHVATVKRVEGTEIIHLVPIGSSILALR